jgi:GNAT superfamily N-acetyltransferase
MSAFEMEFRSVPGTNALRYALVPWDSELFGFPVYELRVEDSPPSSAEAIRGWLGKLDCERGCLVCAKVDHRAVPWLELLSRSGFYPVETMLEAERSLTEVDATLNPPPPGVRWRRATAADSEALQRIAGSAFWADRFHLDHHLSSELADERYVRWIRGAIESGETVFVYEMDDVDAPIGFHLVRPVSDKRIDLTLVAMDSSFAGRGLGPALYQSVVLECAQMGYSTAQMRIVARNLPALNILSRLGFSFRSATESMHWYSPGLSKDPADA